MEATESAYLPNVDQTGQGSTNFGGNTSSTEARRCTARNLPDSPEEDELEEVATEPEGSKPNFEVPTFRLLKWSEDQVLYWDANCLATLIDIHDAFFGTDAAKKNGFAKLGAVQRTTMMLVYRQAAIVSWSDLYQLATQNDWALDIERKVYGAIGIDFWDKEVSYRAQVFQSMVLARIPAYVTWYLNQYNGGMVNYYLGSFQLNKVMYFQREWKETEVRVTKWETEERQWKEAQAAEQAAEAAHQRQQELD
jgi:hypothetical protein